MRSGRACAAAVAGFLLALTAPGTAGAHGAPANPVSRSFACGTEGGNHTRTPACQAARAVGDREAFKTWDFLRVANVKGRDRQVIPDGELCSAGIERFRGLDLPRDDWPATALRPGDRMTMRYRATIPHKGEFRLYLTNDSYDPRKPLRWSHLDAQPFLTITDPPLRGGSYKIDVRLPSDRTGRQLMYVIWQNSDTPDTYYSCSDVVFSGRPDADPNPTPAPEAAPVPGTTDPGVPGAVGTDVPPSTAPGTPPVDGTAVAARPVPARTTLDEATGDPRLADFTRPAPGGWSTFWPIATTLVIVGSGVGLVVTRMRRRIEGTRRDR